MENLYNTSTITIFGKVVAKQENQYTEIVVDDMNRDYTDDLKYVTLVVLPNWNISVELGEIGYFRFQIVEAGKSHWYDKEREDYQVYKYDNNYLINFYKQRDLCKQDTFDFE